ncbi:hypothetical protein ACHAXH_000989 [Discostella pseudostelligera]
MEQAGDGANNVAVQSNDGTRDEIEIVGYQPPDVECPDVASDTLELETVIQGILNNEPRIAGLNVFLSPYEPDEQFSFGFDYDGDDCAAITEKLAHAIGSSKQLRTLKIDDPSIYAELLPGEVSTFFKRIAKNRSIELLALEFLDFSRLDIISILAPFFKHNHNLRCIKISGFDVSKRILSLVPILLRSKTMRLERVDFSHSRLDAKSASDLINALAAMPGLCHLLDLFLTCNAIGREGCTALSNLLKNSSCNIHRVNIHANNLDDKCMEVLSSGLVANRTIKVLDLGHNNLIASNGWRDFSAYLTNPICSVVEIVLRENNIGDEGVISIGNSFASNQVLKLKSLDLSSCTSISSTSWIGLSAGLRSLKIENLLLCSTDIDDDGAVAIISALAKNSSLKTLDMKTNLSISSVGWVLCFRMCLGSEFTLESLLVNDNNINDEGAAVLVESLATFTSLKTLDLGSNPSISAPGWKSFFRSMLDSRFAPKALLLENNNMDNEGASILVQLLTATNAVDTLSLRRNNSISMNGWRRFAEALQPSSVLKVLRLGATSQSAKNNSLLVIKFVAALSWNAIVEELLLFEEDEDPAIDDGAWNALAKVLCNNSSIANIYSSNHTLQAMVEARESGLDFIPYDVFALMRMNRNKNKAEVVRSKILKDFFSDGANVGRTFADLAMTIIPSAICWIGSDRVGFSAMYLLVRSMPWLLDSKTKPSVNDAATAEPPTKLRKVDV